jgi:hypothetical protein
MRFDSQTERYQNKVLASSNIAAAIDYVDNGPLREGNANSLTSMRPLGAGKFRGY